MILNTKMYLACMYPKNDFGSEIIRKYNQFRVLLKVFFVFSLPVMEVLPCTQSRRLNGRCYDVLRRTL